MIEQRTPVGICDDCGRRVTTGPIASGGREAIDVDIPDGIPDEHVEAYALMIAAREMAKPRCRTCLQTR